MLEYDSLTFPPAAMGSGWTIREPVSGKQVGVARRLTREGGFWSRWLGRQRLAVHESEDEPLLCTLHRLWSFREAWELRDADGRVVGKLSRAVLRGRLGRLLTRIESTDGPSTQYRDRQGRTIATLTCSGERVLTFAPACKGDPFTRMMVLGSALIDISRAARHRV
jgi:hypothetical protein